MYARLVVGNANVHPHDCMRDIGRLLTSPSPSIANLTSLAFSNTQSVIVDATPAGWTYVGSNFANDTPSISTGGTYYQGSTASALPQLCFSASCLNSNALKYAILTQILAANTANATSYSIIAVTGAATANSTGGLTGEGPRYYDTGFAGQDVIQSHLYLGRQNSVIHLVSNPRHITIIAEPNTGTINGGFNAIWESSQTDTHTFYNTAPFIQYCHGNSAFSGTSWLANTTQWQGTSGGIGGYFLPMIFNTYNASTGGYNANYDVSVGATQNRGFLVQYYAASGSRNNTIGTTGLSKAVAQPIFYHASAIGYPVQMVSGVTPAYWMRGNIGSSGDQVNINGSTYTYFNCGANFALAMQTS